MNKQINLISHEIKGLSRIDFELAANINHIDFNELDVIPVSGEKNYLREARIQIREKEDQEVSKQLADSFNSYNKDKDLKN